MRGRLEALMAAYEASMAGNDGIDVSEHPTERYSFQDALLWAMSKIHARLDAAGADEDSPGVFGCDIMRLGRNMTMSVHAITAAFARARDEGRTALLPYVMAGYPDAAISEALAVALGEAGADLAGVRCAVLRPDGRRRDDSGGEPQPSKAGHDPGGRAGAGRTHHASHPRRRCC